MTERKWTEGPWVIKRGNVKKDGSQLAYFSGPYWGRFCSVWVRTPGACDDDDEGVANANLIAAAPDLYAVLEAKTIMEADNSNSTWLDAKARAALAKARGETT